MTPTFFVSFVLNSLVILIANTLFPAQVVLGNANSNLWWAVFHSMVMLTLIGTLAVPLFEWKQKMLGRALTTKEWMIGYLVINFVGVWVITRFSEQFGLGISGWWVGLLLAVAFGFVQSKGMMIVYKKEK